MLDNDAIYNSMKVQDAVTEEISSVVRTLSKGDRPMPTAISIKLYELGYRNADELVDKICASSYVVHDTLVITVDKLNSILSDFGLKNPLIENAGL